MIVYVITWTQSIADTPNCVAIFYDWNRVPAFHTTISADKTVKDIEVNTHHLQTIEEAIDLANQYLNHGEFSPEF